MEFPRAVLRSKLPPSCLNLYYMTTPRTFLGGKKTRNPGTQKIPRELYLFHIVESSPWPMCCSSCTVNRAESGRPLTWDCIFRNRTLLVRAGSEIRLKKCRDAIRFARRDIAWPGSMRGTVAMCTTHIQVNYSS
ncbi:unnamed protein product [Periconia digitata]|uniref:Uncharacterized protein n=1 Tax=Periconia digitata TaxID=1303443 RepID=A0A9W4UH11_9PLEO|nr:unnamed protein product [Periconia digitata]